MLMPENSGGARGWRGSSRQGPGGRQAGFSLLEASIALALGSLGVVVIGQAMTATAESLDYVVKDGVASTSLQNAVSGLCEEMRQSAQASITILPGYPGDSVTVMTYDSASQTYGAETTGGLFKPNWKILYWVDPTTGELSRQVLNDKDKTQYGGVIVRNLPTKPSAGTKSFAVTKSGPLYSVSLNVSEHMSDGTSRSRSLSSTVHVKS